MFSRGYSMFRDHRCAKKKSTGSKKHHGVHGSSSDKKKSKADKSLFAVMMSSGESSSPVTISSTGFDVPDEVRLVKITPTTTPSSTTLAKTPKSADNETATPDADVEAIEEATPIVQKTLPVSESTSKIDRNGYDMDMRKTLNDHEEPDECLIDCIYYTQQCCSCTIL